MVKRTEKSVANSRQKSTANSRQDKSRANTRAKPIWHVAFKIQAHRLDRSRSAQEINKHVSGGNNQDREDQRSVRLKQIRS